MCIKGAEQNVERAITRPYFKHLRAPQSHTTIFRSIGVQQLPAANMKSTIVFELAALAAVALCNPSGKDFTQLELPGWDAGDRLFPANVIEGYHDDYNNQTAKSWSHHVLERCRTFEDGTSTISYSGKHVAHLSNAIVSATDFLS